MVVELAVPSGTAQGKGIQKRCLKFEPMQCIYANTKADNTKLAFTIAETAMCLMDSKTETQACSPHRLELGIMHKVEWVPRSAMTAAVCRKMRTDRTETAKKAKTPRQHCTKT